MHPPPARARAGSTRCARTSRPEHHARLAAGQPASSAAAAVDTSGPGLTGSSRNNRAGDRHPAAIGQLERRRDRRGAVPPPSSYRKRLQPADSSASWSASSPAVRAGSATSSAAMICSASGSPPHDLSQPPRSLRVTADPVVIGAGGPQRRIQQLHAGLVVQDGDIHQPGTQPGQGVPGGHQHLVRARPGQQRPHLRFGGGVVGDHQHRVADLRRGPTGTAQPAPRRRAGCARRVRPVLAAAHPAPAPAPPAPRHSRAGQGTAPRREPACAAGRRAPPGPPARSCRPRPAPPPPTPPPAPRPAGSSSPVITSSSFSRPVNAVTGGRQLRQRDRHRRHLNGIEGDVTEVLALQYRPLLDTASDRVTGPLVFRPGHESGPRFRSGGPEREFAEVPALQHRPVLGAAADRVGDIPGAVPQRLGLHPPVLAGPARTRHRPQNGPAGPPPARSAFCWSSGDSATPSAPLPPVATPPAPGPPYDATAA